MAAESIALEPFHARKNGFGLLKGPSLILLEGYLTTRHGIYNATVGVAGEVGNEILSKEKSSQC